MIAPKPSETLSAAVVGAGPAGLSAALTLAGLGVPVHLFAPESAPAGLEEDVAPGEAGEQVGAWLADQWALARSQPGLHVHEETAFDVARWQANQAVARLRQGGESEGYDVRAGAVVIATGAKPATTTEYGHGGDCRILTQSELEARLRDEPPASQSLNRIVMIQCVGSRESERSYCSRTCCARAVSNALRIKNRDPRSEVTILYREMRTVGLHELAYEAARRAGVTFIRYELSQRPIVRARDGQPLRVRVRDPLLGQEVDLEADWVVLSTGIEPAPPPWSTELGATFGRDGFMEPEHEKMRPLNLQRPGLFGCGAAMGPCFMDEAIVQGRGAALLAAAYLRRLSTSRPAVGAVASVNERLCSGCELCVSACPYEARRMDPEVRLALVDEERCAGCGICATVCPNGATQQRLFEAPAMLAMIDEAVTQRG